MEHLRGYDAWKTRVPDPGTGGSGKAKGYQHTKMLWFRAYRFAKRHGQGDQWLETQRGIPLFADFVKEADAQRHR
jgi:hypothetical protein